MRRYPSDGVQWHGKHLHPGPKSLSFIETTRKQGRGCREILDASSVATVTMYGNMRLRNRQTSLDETMPRCKLYTRTCPYKWTYTTHMPKSLHRDHTSKSFQRLDDLFTLFFWNRFLHHLWCTFHKLLAVDQTQSQHALDLFDDFLASQRYRMTSR